MPSTVFDFSIFRDLFGTPAMRAIFSDEALAARYVEVEVALAKAQAHVGVIPRAAADAIAANADTRAIDLGKLKTETDVVGYPIVGVVHQMAKQCGDAGRYVHWGATTQDIMDTASVLQIRDALGLVEADLDAIATALASLARRPPRHRHGRAHPSAACPARDLRLQGRCVAGNDRASPPAARAAEAARARRAVLRRGRHARVSR